MFGVFILQENEINFMRLSWFHVFVYMQQNGVAYISVAAYIQLKTTRDYNDETPNRRDTAITWFNL